MQLLSEIVGRSGLAKMNRALKYLPENVYLYYMLKITIAKDSEAAKVFEALQKKREENKEAMQKAVKDAPKPAPKPV